ncbi:MAG: N-formylglutamate amidohydrolase [Phycisphaerales bacterium]
MARFPTNPGVVISCEHATNRVPGDLRAAFRGARAALASHRGWDPGSVEVGCALAGELAAPLLVSRVSRLVVDCNRSPAHPRVFSEWSKALPAAERDALLRRWHGPHRDAVERAVVEATARAGACLHISVHSFTPTLDGRTRPMDIGLLFDPGRPAEKAFAITWRRALLATEPEWVVHFNGPYKGVSDGLCTSLRGRFGPLRYAGVELEVNQRLVGTRGALGRVADACAASIRAALADSASG